MSIYAAKDRLRRFIEESGGNVFQRGKPDSQRPKHLADLRVSIIAAPFEQAFAIVLQNLLNQKCDSKRVDLGILLREYEGEVRHIAETSDILCITFYRLDERFVNGLATALKSENPDIKIVVIDSDHIARNRMIDAFFSKDNFNIRNFLDTLVDLAKQ